MTQHHDGTGDDLLRHVDTWVFDLDNTLYPAACNLFAQVDRRMTAFIAESFGLPPADARALQKQYFRSHGTTLRGLMTEHGVDPTRFLDYVHDIDVTCLPPSPGLDRALAALPGRKVVFTNGSTKHAEGVLARLGVADRFDAIWDIVAGGYVPKPLQETYDRMIDHLGVDPARAVMVEDIAANLVPAHRRGMTTVWVDTGEAWAAPPQVAPHIDLRIADVADWLSTLVAARAAPPQLS
ncbi:MAG: pyrimidine 5'-nucleotidase [Rhodospirillaceae bacterium]|nr:pyrimidine 5'-nucleotidase [Rhodospirillaceae bacterium]